MTTISAGDLTKLRNSKHSSKFYLSVLKPTTLLSARVNDSGISRGDRSIVYDTGSSSDFSAVEAGQTLWVGTTAGDNDVGKIRVKSISGTASSGTITVDENGIDWGDDLHLTILHNYEIWAIPPRIDGGVFYKFYNTTYSNQNSQPNPVAIAGPHQAGFLSGGSLVLNVPVGDSYATAQGAAISSKSVTVSPSSGASVGSESGGLIPITYSSAGTYWVKTTAQDDNGKSETTYRVHFVYDSDNLPYNDFSVTSVSGDWNSSGYSFDVEVYGDAALSDFPDGTLVVLWREGRINDAEDYVNVWSIGDNIICAGYLRSDNNTDNLSQGDGVVRFSVTTPDGVLANRTEMGPISVEATTSPAAWYQYASWLTVGRAVHHLLKWHSTALQTCDIYGLLDNTLGVEVAEFSENSLLSRVNGLGEQRGIFSKMVSDRLGRLHFVEDRQMFNETNRDAEDTVFSITRQDLGGEVNLAREPEKRTALAFLDGFSFDGSTATALISIAGGYVDGSGTSIQIPEPEGSASTNVTRQVLNSQSDSNEKCGRLLAAANNPLKELRTPLRSDYLGAFDIIPSLGWYQWGITDTVLKRNLALNGKSFLCRRVQHRLDVSAGTINTDVGLEAEAEGPDGIQGNYPTSYPAVTLPEPNWTLPAAVVDCGGITVNTPDSFESGTINVLASVKLSSTQHLVVWNEGSSNNGVACVLDISGDTVTAGTAHTFESNGIGKEKLAVCALSSTDVCVVYADDSDFDYYAIILQVSGSTVSSGTREAITSTYVAQLASSGATASTLSSTKVFATWESNVIGGPYTIEGVVLDISGTTITVNTSQTIDSDASIVLPGSAYAKPLSSSSVLLAYESAGDIVARVISGITTTFTINSAATLRAGTNFDIRSLSLIDSTSYVVSYIDFDASPDVFYIFAGTITGTTVNTPGSDVEIYEVAGTSANVVKAEVLDDNATIIIVYWENDSSDTAAQSICASVDGTTITLGSDSAVAATAAVATPASYHQIDLVSMDNTRAMFAYREGTSGDGYGVILEAG